MAAFAPHPQITKVQRENQQFSLSTSVFSYLCLNHKLREMERLRADSRVLGFSGRCGSLKQLPCNIHGLGRALGMKFWWTRNCATNLTAEKVKAADRFHCHLINTATIVSQSLTDRLTYQLIVTCYQSSPNIFSLFSYCLSCHCLPKPLQL